MLAILSCWILWDTLFCPCCDGQLLLILIWLMWCCALVDLHVLSWLFITGVKSPLVLIYTLLTWCCTGFANVLFIVSASLIPALIFMSFGYFALLFLLSSGGSLGCWDLYFFLMCLIKAMNFPVSNALATPHKLWCALILLSFSSKHFLMPLVISSLICV